MKKTFRPRLISFFYVNGVHYYNKLNFVLRMEKKTLYPDIIKRVRAFIMLGYNELFKTPKDGAFTTGLIATGLIGCFSVLYLQASKVGQPEHTLVLTSGVPEPQAMTVGAKLPMATSSTQPKYMEIIGSRKAGSSLSFAIDAYHPTAEYLIDFGDGTSTIAEGQTVVHKYERSGVYMVSMHVNYRGEKKSMPVEQIWIER